ncbi:MAG: 5'-deoxynucleotidase [Oscillospiraceae bacterium]
MSYNFFALVSRMKNIGRWSLMRNFSPENVQEHSHMVAVIAHALAVIRRDVFGRDAEPDKAAAAALFHDASEIFTGDMPTPVKYFNPEIMSAYKAVEKLADNKLLSTLPREIRPAYEKLIEVPDNTRDIIKAADTLSAYIKCLEELKAGNSEFLTAARQTKEKLLALDMPEVVYFLENFIPAFELTLDELNYSIQSEEKQ